MKSGTTLLRALLGQHPMLYASFETHWFDEAIRDKWIDPSSNRMKLLLSLLSINHDEYQMFCRIKTVDCDREFIDIVMEYCCKRSGKQRWVEKTPDNIRYWSVIQNEWPDAYLIHVTREYKDVYASWKTRRNDSLDCFLSSVASVYSDIRQLLGKETDRYIEVDYTELVFNTIPAIRRILAKIGEEWSDNCAALDIENMRREREKLSNILGRESWTMVSLTRNIFTNSVGQWKSLINEEESRKIESELYELYRIYGDKWRDRGRMTASHW